MDCLLSLLHAATVVSLIWVIDFVEFIILAINMFCQKNKKKMKVKREIYEQSKYMGIQGNRWNQLFFGQIDGISLVVSICMGDVVVGAFGEGPILYWAGGDKLSCRGLYTPFFLVI